MTDTGGMELLEREPSLALLADCAAEARRGDGRLVVLGGEAGVGKTALLERFHETPVPRRSDAMESRFQCVRRSERDSGERGIAVTIRPSGRERLLDRSVPARSVQYTAKVFGRRCDARRSRGSRVPSGRVLRGGRTSNIGTGPHRRMCHTGK